MKKKSTLLHFVFLIYSFSIFSQSVSNVWVSDLGNGSYINPVLVLQKK